MSNDPFSDLLTLTNAQSVISGGFSQRPSANQCERRNSIYGRLCVGEALHQQRLSPIEVSQELLRKILRLDTKL